MIKKAIILHGKPKRERYENPDLPKPHEANWLPWIQSQLAKRGISAAIPQLPRPYSPVYKDWKEEIDSFDIDTETALIGHSAGADFILRLLSENKDLAPARVALVAPWHDTEDKYGDFSHYELDRDIGNRVGRIAIFNSLDDRPPIQTNVRRIKDIVSEAHLIQLDGFGHFMLGNNMDTEEFPELLAELDRRI